MDTPVRNVVLHKKMNQTYYLKSIILFRFQKVVSHLLKIYKHYVGDVIDPKEVN